jgi:chromosome segregation ATPase
MQLTTDHWPLTTFSILAISDGWVIGMWAIQLAVSAVLGLVLAWVANRTREIETLKSQLRSTAEELVETQIAVRTGELMTALKVLTAEVQTINKRLERGDAEFDGLGEGAHKLELKTQSMLGELKQWVMANMATRDDVKTLNDRFDGLQRAVAKDMADKIGMVRT